MTREPNDRVTISYRCPERLRKRIEEAAAADGLNLTQEITKCIEYSLNEEERIVYKSPIIRIIALALRQAELASGKNYYQDEITAQKFRNTTIGILDIFYPFRPLSNMLASKGEISDGLDAAELVMSVDEPQNDAEVAQAKQKAAAFADRLKKLWQSSRDERAE